MFERRPGQESIDAVKVHVVDSRIDFRIGGIITHVDDEGLTAWPKNAINFDQSANRIAEVFKRRAASHEIEAIAREWQCRGIALSELNINACLLCIGRRHTYE